MLVLWIGVGFWFCLVVYCRVVCLLWVGGVGGWNIYVWIGGFLLDVFEFLFGWGCVYLCVVWFVCVVWGMLVGCGLGVFVGSRSLGGGWW